ncbi:MAG: hypothetical protein ACODAJ_17365 [Planctomycetota bacterium]
MRRLLLCLVLLVPAVALAGELDKPGMPTPDDMDKPGKRPAPAPAVLTDEETDTEPAPEDEEEPKPKGHSPFRRRGTKPKYAVPARITYSDGKTLEGWVWRRANAPIRLFDRKDKAHEDYFLGDLRRIAVKTESTTFERDWRWKNQGSSIKVFLKTGYLWNQYETTFVTRDGERAAGDCSGQFYILLTDGTKTKWDLYKRHSGRGGPHRERQDLQPLRHVKTVEFTDDFLKKPQDEKATGEATEEAAKP